MTNSANGRTSEYRSTDPLREGFVAMLFALAIAQVAINAAAVFAVSAALESKLAASAHLIVALLLIACSWVGWRQSRSPGLLLDVLLVVLYFIIVQ
jgi:hypothetical protein